MKLITLFLTCANRDKAKKITDALLEKDLTACVKATGVKSDYWWKGQRERSDEVLLIIESAEEKYDDIERTVRELHSYETFVLMAYPVLRSSTGVDKWIGDTLKK